MDDHIRHPIKRAHINYEKTEEKGKAMKEYTVLRVEDFEDHEIKIPTCAR